MIALGTFDGDANLNEYLEQVKKLTGVSGGNWETQLRDEGHWVKPSKTDAPITVRQLQEFLQTAGFFPHGKIDGICGYRTTSALRLFQEYVRSVEGNPEIGFPDGRLGPNSLLHVQRWKTGGLKADWGAPSAEYAQWLSLLDAVKTHYQAAPSAVMSKVAAFPKACDTIGKIADWDFGPDRIHLIGIRHRKSGAGADAQVLDDVYVLLIHGMVFKFFGSTEPGTKTPDVTKYPFLVPGQHLYRFGWHHRNDENAFQALLPAGKGVLVLRSANRIPTDADLAGPLDGPNETIHIHWSADNETAVWSAGCQVLSGRSYINHRGQRVDCSKFTASGYKALGTTDAQKIYRTKGAYTVLEDLVAALSGAVPNDNVVRYMLLLEQDLDLHPGFGSALAAKLLSQLKSA